MKPSTWRTVELECIRGNNSGELGLAIVGMREQDTDECSNGAALAHDVLEHQNGPGEIGGIDDELEALGALWYTRGQHGELVRNSASAYSPAFNVASDVARMFRDYVDGGAQVLVGIKHCTRAVEHDDNIKAIVLEARRQARVELDPDTCDDNMREQWPLYAAVALARMRIGYRKARRTWESAGQFAGNNTFWAIADAANPYCTSPEYEGARFTLRYRAGEATCEQVYPED